MQVISRTYSNKLFNFLILKKLLLLEVHPISEDTLFNLIRVTCSLISFFVTLICMDTFYKVNFLEQNLLLWKKCSILLAIFKNREFVFRSLSGQLKGGERINENKQKIIH